VRDQIRADDHSGDLGIEDVGGVQMVVWLFEANVVGCRSVFLRGCGCDGLFHQLGVLTTSGKLLFLCKRVRTLEALAMADRSFSVSFRQIPVALTCAAFMLTSFRVPVEVFITHVYALAWKHISGCHVSYQEL